MKDENESLKIKQINENNYIKEDNESNLINNNNNNNNININISDFNIVDEFPKNEINKIIRSKYSSKLLCLTVVEFGNI